MAGRRDHVHEDAVRLAPAIEGLIAALMRSRLGEIEPSALTTTQHVLLTVVADVGPVRLNVLAVRIGTTNATASRTVDSLVELGLVERAPDPDDGRGVLIAVTSRGRSAVQTSRQSLVHMLTRLLETMEANDRTRFVELLDQLSVLYATPAKEGLPSLAPTRVT